MVEAEARRAGPGRPSDARERLVRAATACIVARSYTCAGVEELCARAGVGKSSFYHFFPAKHDLALAVLDHYWGSYKRRYLARAFADDVPPGDRMVRVFTLAYEAQRTLHDAAGRLPGCLLGNMTLEMGAQDEVIRNKIAQILTEWSGHFERALRDAVAAGVCPEIDIPTTAQALLAYLEGVLLLAKAHNDPDVITRLSDGVRRLALIADETAP
jgi:TetR/AcrR family transcriptional repressor of nem operon